MFAKFFRQCFEYPCWLSTILSLIPAFPLILVKTGIYFCLYHPLVFFSPLGDNPHSPCFTLVPATPNNLRDTMLCPLQVCGNNVGNCLETILLS